MKVRVWVIHGCCQPQFGITRYTADRPLMQGARSLREADLRQRIPQVIHMSTPEQDIVISRSGRNWKSPNHDRTDSTTRGFLGSTTHRPSLHGCNPDRRARLPPPPRGGPA
jgi:hypothetical protein